jgi:hypothetical protein
MNRRIAPLFVIAVFAAVMTACSSPKSQQSQPQPPAIAISISSAPPSSLDMNATAQIAATVTNDSADEGVDWTCAPAASCGTFTPTHTASGANTTYQASNTPGTVTITAASTAKPTVTTSATVTINALTISITTAPPSSMEINSSAQIGATVTNDISNGGVDWSCAPVASCGSFTPTHTASGADTVYQALSTAGTVTITAASTTQPTVTASKTVTISPVGGSSNLSGTYTYYANGWDSNFDPYSIVGSIVLDGNGNVTGGEQDYFDLYSGTIDTADPIVATGGTITFSGADGRGSLTITPTNLGTPETFSVVLVNNNHLLIAEFDSSATSAGSMDLQTVPSSVPMGGNAFAFFDSWDAFSAGGVLTSNGTAITAGDLDYDYQGSPSFGNTFSGDVINAPDPAGRGTMTVDGLQFAYYVVGPEAFRMIEIDGSSYLAGSMFGQGTAAGAFSAASLTGSYVFSQSGADDVGIFEWGAAGEFTTDATSTLTAGVADLNLGDGNPVLAGSVANSQYTVGSDGYGNVTLASALDGLVQNFGIYLVDPTLNITDPNSTTGGGGAFIVDLDSNSLGVGVATPQSSGATFAGNYAFNQDGYYVTATPTSSLFDLIGQVLSDGTSTLQGNADFNDLNNTGLNPGVPVIGAFTPDAVNAGRSTAQISINGSGGVTTENITLYQASDGLLFHVDTDSPSSGNGNTAVGVFEKQQ